MSLLDSRPATGTTGLARRDTLRLGLLGLGLLGGAGTLTACGGSDDPSDDPTTAGDDGIELVSSDVKRAAGDPSVLPDVIAGLQAFTGGLYDGLATEPGNLVLSPYSVLVALGMTLVGADGVTAEEMSTVLGADQQGDRWHKGVNALTAHIDGLAGEQERSDDSKAEIALATANQLFGQHGAPWQPDFLDLLAKEYGAALRAVDFETAAEQARTLINGWVEDQTHDKIVDLIPEGVLTAATRLVLVNAIYLKAPWEDPFEKDLTDRADFFLADGSTVQVDTMHKSDLSASVSRGKGWQAATIPYAGRELAMTIVLPDPGGRDAAYGRGLEEVERVLATSGPAGFVTGGSPSRVEISLPKWTFRTAAPLADVLKRLGMPAAFSDEADFSLMTEDDEVLVLSEVLHQGFIAVDEEGTEAAAATAAVMDATAVPMTEKFVVDRPFLFVIHDVEHGTPLFVGRVADPTS